MANEKEAKIESKVDDSKKKKRNTRALNERYAQRITLVKMGKEASYKKDYVRSIKNYNSYLSLLAEVKDTDVNTLGPQHFDPVKEQAEMLLISHIYWEMSKILDRSPNLEAEFQRCLYKFVEFSVGYGYQVVNAEMLRKFLRKSKQIHTKEFQEAYKKIYIVSSKCYIATHCFGENDIVTNAFREFKGQLANYSLGLSFIRLYYLYSPKLIKLCEKNKFLSYFVTNLCFRPILYILYRLFLHGTKGTKRN